MKTDLPPWKEDPNNPTRKSGEKRKDKYGNEIKNVAKHLARKAMNSVKEAVFVSSRKKDLTAAKSEDTLVFDDHINCGTPDCCQTCDTADTTEIDEASAFADARRDLRRDSKGLAPTKRDEDDSESKEDPDEDKTPHLVSQLYKAVSINKPVKFKDGKSHTIAPHHAKKFINQYRSLKPADKEELQSKAHASHAEFKKAISEDIVRTGTLAQRTQAYRADKAKKAGAKLKMDPDTGTPDHFTAAMRRKKGLPEEVESKVYSVHVKGDSAQHNSPEFKKYLAGWGGEKHYTSDKGAAYKFKKEYQATGFHHGVGSMFKKLDSEHDGLVKEEVDGLQELSKDTLKSYTTKRTMGVDPSGSTNPNTISSMKQKAKANSTLGNDAEAARLRNKAKISGKSTAKAYARMGEKGMPGSAVDKAAKKMPSSYRSEEVEQINEYGIDQNAHSVSAGYTPKTPPKTKPIAKPTMHPAAEKPRTPQSSVGSLSRIRGAMAKRVNNSTVKEELGKSNEWGTDALRKKYAAMTPGQEGLAAKNIPTFDARYDDVPTKYCGGIQKEETLSEISARGVIARQDFKAKLQKVLSDPKAIARAKKTIAKKKAAEADVPKNLVHQLHKSQSINAKVKFYDGKEHEIASNHHDKFMNKYHGLKSSIEKESLVNRAHKSHEEFLKAIHEEWADFSQEKPNTDSINPANYPAPPMHNDMLDYNSDDRHDEYDLVAIENDVAAEIENAEWEDLVDYYDYEDLNYEDSDEDIAEGITPQGRLKKRFNMMRTKGRRNLARNMALKRVATPDRIKSRSVRAARNMVYSRVLRGRDRSSLSASEKTRLEGMVKRMAPMVGRLSVRLQQKERMIDRKRINNRNKRKKK
jgi:hypothetical protein